MITRPVIMGAFDLPSPSQSTLSAIIFDDTFSMQGQNEIVRNAAYKILKEIPEKNQLIWININNGLQFKGIKEDLPSLDHLLNYTYYPGMVTDALYLLDQTVEGQFKSREVFILTDRQYSSIIELKNNKNILKNWNAYFFNYSTIG